jgi:hypothetical protein
VGPGRDATSAPSLAEWKAIRAQVLARAGWRCQACGVQRRLDVHHVVKRSQGGSHFDLGELAALCRWCHDQTDAPYERGRLVVTALGAGQFTFGVVQRAAGGKNHKVRTKKGQKPLTTPAPPVSGYSSIDLANGTVR